MAGEVVSALIGAIAGLLGGVIAVGLTWRLNRHSEEESRTKQAHYLAIRVVCVLDKFAENCMDIIADDGSVHGQRNPDGYSKPQIEAPRSIDYPQDVDWKSIDNSLMYKLLSFPSDFDIAWRSINATEEIIDPDDDMPWFEERAYQFAKLGKSAVVLATQLRNTYGIPRHESSGRADFFETQKQDIEKERAAASNTALQLPPFWSATPPVT